MRAPQRRRERELTWTMEYARSLRADYEDGASIRTLAKREHRSYTSVHEMLDVAGTTFRGRGGNRTGVRYNIDAAMLGQLRREYEAGATISTLARRHPPCVAAIRKALVAAGVEIRPHGWKHPIRTSAAFAVITGPALSRFRCPYCGEIRRQPTAYALSVGEQGCVECGKVSPVPVEPWGTPPPLPTVTTAEISLPA